MLLIYYGKNITVEKPEIVTDQTEAFLACQGRT